MGGMSGSPMFEGGASRFDRHNLRMSKSGLAAMTSGDFAETPPGHRTSRRGGEVIFAIRNVVALLALGACALSRPGLPDVAKREAKHLAGPVERCKELEPSEQSEEWEVRLDVREAEMAGATLRVHFGYAGGCDRHEFRLCYSYEGALQDDTRVRMKLTDWTQDACEGGIETWLAVDLGPLKREYQARSGKTGSLLLDFGRGLAVRYAF